MTAKQKMYLDLCKGGYSLQEIADMTKRRPFTVLRGLLAAIDKPCKSQANCSSCPLESTCAVDRAIVAKVSRRASDKKYIDIDELPKSRYSY